MNEPINDLDPPATFEQPTWKHPRGAVPRHRVDPMRPANPHTDDPELEDLYQDFYRERAGRGGPNLTAALILLVVCFLVAGFLSWVALWAYGTWTS